METIVKFIVSTYEYLHELSFISNKLLWTFELNIKKAALGIKFRENRKSYCFSFG